MLSVNLQNTYIQNPITSPHFCCYGSYPCRPDLSAAVPASAQQARDPHGLPSPGTKPQIMAMPYRSYHLYPQISEPSYYYSTQAALLCCWTPTAPGIFYLDPPSTFTLTIIST